MFAILFMVGIFAGVLMAFGMPLPGALLFGALGTGAVLYFVVFKPSQESARAREAHGIR